MQRTFAIIKPDAVERRLVGQILARIEQAGFTIRAMRLQHLTKREAEGFYAVHRERPFFGGLTNFMSSGPSVLLAFLKLRQRTLGPMLEANGWAVNGRVKVNMPLGAALTELKTLPAGSVYTEPSNGPHFAMTGDEPVVVLITGTGPTDTVYENPADDPTRKP